MSEQKQDIITFGHALLSTEDLDPLYVGLHALQLPQDQLYRWLVAYWCFYHVGFASWASEREGADFWGAMLEAGKNKSSPRFYNLPSARWPRAAERRHFRGQTCVTALRWMTLAFPRPEDLVRSIIISSMESGRWSQSAVMRETQKLPLFGPWISFKVADMLERVEGVPIEFDENIGLIYHEPLAGLKLWAEWCGETPALTVERHYAGLLEEFAGVPAPPVTPEGRGVGPQEVETILCKWKSYMGGHYYVGKDIKEHRAALQGWGCTAEMLLEAYPPLPSSLG